MRVAMRSTMKDLISSEGTFLQEVPGDGRNHEAPPCSKISQSRADRSSCDCFGDDGLLGGFEEDEFIFSLSSAGQFFHTFI
jgi:hypothetical protein